MCQIVKCAKWAIGLVVQIGFCGKFAIGPSETIKQMGPVGQEAQVARVVICSVFSFLLVFSLDLKFVFFSDPLCTFARCLC